jgi:flagellar biosynthesis/type III secretory pathway protein FliH
MLFKDIVKLLANRINQPHVIRTYLKKVYDSGLENGYEEGLKDGQKETTRTLINAQQIILNKINERENTQEARRLIVDRIDVGALKEVYNEIIELPKIK